MISLVIFSSISSVSTRFWIIFVEFGNQQELYVSQSNECKKVNTIMPLMVKAKIKVIQKVARKILNSKSSKTPNQNREWPP